jgi:hypothetical protein
VRTLRQAQGERTLAFRDGHNRAGLNGAEFAMPWLILIVAGIVGS